MPMRRGQDLQAILEKGSPGYAYEMMALEIELDEQKNNENSKKESISRLLELYMIGVEVLESKSDRRYKYFNEKIQILMKKKFIIQELYKSRALKMQKQHENQLNKVNAEERKNDYDLQVFLNKEQFNTKKIKEMVSSAEDQLKKISSKVQTNIKKQDRQLQQRIKMRKMRSEAGSVQKFKVDRGKVVQKNFISGLRYLDDDYFQSNGIKIERKKKGSIEKDQKKKQLLF